MGSLSIYETGIRSVIIRACRKYLPLLVLPAVFVNAYSQENVVTENWSSNSAFTMPKGKWGSGIIQQFRYGIGEKTELFANALLVPVLPNAGVRLNLGTAGEFRFASSHSVSIPSLFLNIVSFKGVGGLISPQYTFDFIASFSNSISVSKEIGQSSLLTGSAGFAFSVRGSKPAYEATIDVPFIYQRMAHWYEGASVRAELSYKGTIAKNLFFEECARIFVITRPADNFFVENSGTIMWASKGSFRIRGGYIVSWGKYPFGTHLQMWPVVDFVFGSKREKQGPAQ